VRPVGDQPTSIPDGRLDDNGTLRIDQLLSPAESVVVLIEALLTAGPDGALPAVVVRRGVLDPMTDPPGADRDALDPEAVSRAAARLHDTALRQGAVPVAVPLDGDRVGVASLYVGFAEAVAALAGDGSVPRVALCDPAPSRRRPRR